MSDHIRDGIGGDGVIVAQTPLFHSDGFALHLDEIAGSTSRLRLRRRAPIPRRFPLISGRSCGGYKPEQLPWNVFVVLVDVVDEYETVAQ